MTSSSITVTCESLSFGRLVRALGGEVWQHCSFRGCLALLTACACGRVIWWQYSVLLNRKLPRYEFELPILGSNFDLVWNGYVNFARKVVKQQSVRLCNFFGINSVFISWPIYERYVKKADNGGQLDQGAFPEAMTKLMGENSILFLRAGKGQEKHHRLRSKVLTSLTPKRVLSMVPDMIAVIREVLDKMTAETAAQGFSRMDDHTSEIPKRITALPIMGNVSADVARRFDELMTDYLGGLLATPVNLGRFSAYGRALNAREEFVAMIRELLSRSDGERSNVIADLAASSADSAGFSEMEIVDTVLTLFFAGQFTTVDSLPPLMAELAQRPEWREKIAAEPLEFDQIEGDGVTVNFVREVLRHYPPEVFMYRQSKTCPLSLGEHGEVPAGCNVVAVFGDAMWSMGEDFNPDRWTHSAVQNSFLTFGGSSPHSCVGRSIFMVEAQLFARILCREYNFQILDTTRVRNWQYGGMFYKYKDGCKVKISKK